MTRNVPEAPNPPSIHPGPSQTTYRLSKPTATSRTTENATYKSQYHQMDSPDHQTASGPNWADQTRRIHCTWTTAGVGVIPRRDPQGRWYYEQKIYVGFLKFVPMILQLAVLDICFNNSLSTLHARQDVNKFLRPILGLVYISLNIQIPLVQARSDRCG